MKLGIMGYEEFDQFKTICNSFVKDGEPVNGQIPVFGTKRIIQYRFDDAEVICNLKYDEKI
jgi:hypothetical protein